MNAWKQFWNGVWTYGPPTDPTTPWWVESFREFFIAGFVAIPFICGFVLYIKWLDWHYIVKPGRKADAELEQWKKENE